MRLAGTIASRTDKSPHNSMQALKVPRFGRGFIVASGEAGGFGCGSETAVGAPSTTTGVTIAVGSGSIRGSVGAVTAGVSRGAIVAAGVDVDSVGVAISLAAEVGIPVGVTDRAASNSLIRSRSSPSPEPQPRSMEHTIAWRHRVPTIKRVLIMVLRRGGMCLTRGRILLVE
jgi:hypothetical protein